MLVTDRTGSSATVNQEVVHLSKERKRLGERGENAAAAYMERAGFTILERNWRCRYGEVDVIALDGNEIVLCEVKTRRTDAKGSAEAAVDARKQTKYRNLAMAYLQHAGTQEVAVRFDVITLRVLTEDRALLRHLRAAYRIDTAS